MKKVLFYITGHGFGHATRTIEVVNQLITKDPEVFPLINTSVPEWLLKQQIPVHFQYVQCENDIAVVQKDWRSVDKFETLRRYGEFIKKEPEFTRAQMDFVKQNNVAAVVSDIPAAAFVVAKKAGVPSFGITNFSWDWIYRPYVRQYPRYRHVVEHIRECYSAAERLLRLPFHGDLSAFPVVEDIPLIATHSAAEREEVLDNLKITADRKIVLLYLGRFNYERVLSDEMLRREDYLFLPPETCKMSNLLFIDLLKAADVVITKPGYGIVSECIANQTPILYTGREDFAEYDVLVEGIKKYAHSRYIPGEDLLSGRWTEHLDQLLATEYRWPEIAIDGAEVAATRILQSI